MTIPEHHQGGVEHLTGLAREFDSRFSLHTQPAFDADFNRDFVPKVKEFMDQFRGCLFEIQGEHAFQWPETTFCEEVEFYNGRIVGNLTGIAFIGYENEDDEVQRCGLAIVTNQFKDVVTYCTLMGVSKTLILESSIRQL